MEKQKKLLKVKTVQHLPISIKLVSVNILSFSLNNEFKVQNDKDFVFELGVSNNIKLNENSIDVVVIVKIFSDKTKKNELGVVKTSNIFEIRELKKHIKVEDNKNKLPEVLLASIVGISISNTRGILIAKATGTVLSKAIIPVINPTEFIRNKERNRNRDLE